MKAKTKIIYTLAALAAAGASAYYFAGIRGGAGSETIYATVEEGQLVININEAGAIKPREQLIIKSDLEGR